MVYYLSMQDLDINALPDDAESLKALIVDQISHLQDKDKQLAEHQKELNILREQITLLLQKRFGVSSEKHPGQQELFDEVEGSDDDQVDDTKLDTDSEIKVAGHKRRRAGRKPLPAHLPRVEVIHDLPEEEQICAADGHRLHRIGEEISEQLDIIPAKIQVIRHIRPKYACRHCETGIKTASLPTQIIPKSIATPGLLAHIAISKYADALPLYRQEQMFKRIGVELSRTSMAQWMIHTAKILAPLMDLLHQQLLASRVLQMDETPIQVLKEPGKTPQSKSYMWVILSGSADPPVVWYDYDPSRGRAVPERLLGDYAGYLVTDGYAGYQSVTARNQITGLGCWAHARRKFDEAMKVQGTQRSGRAHYAMSEIRKLYAIERKMANKNQDERYQIRQTQAKAIIDKLRTWLDKTRPQVPPKTTLGKALRYLDNEWPRLVRYLDDAELPLDNNRCENAIRPFVIGRKNWMFSASQTGARASATLYSLIETAKHNRLEPYRYLRYVLTEIAKGQKDVKTLLPFNLKSEDIDC